MPRSSNLKSLIEARSRYTGEPYQYVRGNLGETPSLVEIATPQREQLLLESLVMKHAGAGGWFWPHALGFAGSRLMSDVPLFMLDRETQGFRRAMYKRAHDVMWNVLPSADRKGNVVGPVGLRVVEANGRDLTLGLVASRARVVLRGAAKVQWRQMLEQFASTILDAKGYPLWWEPELSNDERRLLTEYPSLTAENERLAWIGSGLLRRHALLWKCVSPYHVRAWDSAGGTVWVVELSFALGVDPAHDELLRALSHPISGIGVRVRRADCYCSGAASERSCKFFLVARDGKPGELQLRFEVDSHVGMLKAARESLSVSGIDGSRLNALIPDVAIAGPQRDGRERVGAQ